MIPCTDLVNCSLHSTFVARTTASYQKMQLRGPYRSDRVSLLLLDDEKRVNDA